MKCCLEVKRVVECVDIVRMWMSRCLGVKVSTLNYLIWEVSRCEGVSSAYEIYREVFELGSERNVKDVKRVDITKPNVHTFNALIVCFYREGMFEKVEETWIEMERLKCETICYSYSVLMAVFCEEGRMREAHKLFDEMSKRKIEHGIVVYNTIIGGYCKIEEIEKVDEFFKQMGLSGIESIYVTFDHLVNGYCIVGDVDSEILVYKDMCRKDFRPESSTIEAMIGGLCDKRRVCEALKILRVEVQMFGLSPMKKSYVCLIKGLCEEEKMEEALNVQVEMMGKGFEPSLEIHNAFIDGYRKQGNVEVATKLRTEMLETQKRNEES